MKFEDLSVGDMLEVRAEITREDWENWMKIVNPQYVENFQAAMSDPGGISSSLVIGKLASAFIAKYDLHAVLVSSKEEFILPMHLGEVHLIQYVDNRDFIKVNKYCTLTEGHLAFNGTYYQGTKLKYRRSFILKFK